MKHTPSLIRISHNSLSIFMITVALLIVVFEPAQHAVLLMLFILLTLTNCLMINYFFKRINQLTHELASRTTTHLEPICLKTTYPDFKRLIAALNVLIEQTRHTIMRNKRFASDAAHELRTPLAALKTHTQVAIQADSLMKKNEALNQILACVDRSTHLVDQLLTLARLSPEARLHDLQQVDIGQLAKNTVARLANTALQKAIEIALEPLPKPQASTLLGNEVSLGILMRNLIDNAIRYTPEGGEVNVAVMEDKTQVVFIVEDTGPGIPEALHERIFERFYRILGTQATGSGLGFAIVKQIADLHHAKIILGTPSNGKGLSVKVVFLR